MIVVDTSALVDSICGEGRSEPSLRQWLERGERLAVPALVLYEWLRGPRTSAELALQRSLFPDAMALPFRAEEADRAAQLYRALKGARRRELDIAIAACALVNRADLWTLNPRDFADIPGLTLAAASAVPAPRGRLRIQKESMP